MHAFLMGGGAEKWLAELGVSNAPMTRAGLATALDFFHREMPELPRPMRFNFLKGMDLHKPVQRVMLSPPALLAAYRRATEDPLKLFFTKAGTSIHSLGVNPGGRAFQRFRIVRPAPALESIATGAIDKWSDAGNPYIADGGGRQYIVPRAWMYLEVEV